MASIINASTSGAGGVITTADASGELQLQSGGNAVVSFTNTGGTAPRITGDFSNATPSNRFAFQTSTTNGSTQLNLIPNGTSKYAGITFFNSSDPDNSSVLSINSNLAGTFFNITSAITGTGTYLPIQFFVNNAVQARIQNNGNFEFNSGYGSSATAYGCRAWVNFDGTGTVAIRASGNVSSITDNGTGNYTLNFTNAMPDANYNATASASSIVGTTAVMVQIASNSSTANVAPTTTALNIAISNWAGSLYDPVYCSLSVFR
jgi:hypothetical protein